MKKAALSFRFRGRALSEEVVASGTSMMISTSIPEISPVKAYEVRQARFGRALSLYSGLLPRPASTSSKGTRSYFEDPDPCVALGA